MDATYKTTKYELVLFFIAVKTNLGYSVLAEFVVQSEMSEQISKALSILSSWNPEWLPQFFMTDYSEAEMGAILKVFPMCQTYLCDFIENSHGNDGLKSGNTVSLLIKLNNCFVCCVAVLMLHLQQMPPFLLISTIRNMLRL